MNKIIKGKELAKPFNLNGQRIVAVSTSGGVFGNCHFQVCGEVWCDGAYSAQDLIDAGADAQEINDLVQAELERGASLVGSLAD